MGTETFLIVRLSSLGDVVLATPVFESLKAARPGCRTSVLVKRAFAPVFDRNPFIDEVLVFEERGFWGWAREIRRRRYDVLLDLHDTPRSRLWGWFSGAGRVVRYDKRTWERRRLVRTKETSPRLDGKVVDRYLECLKELGVPATARQPRLYVDRSSSTESFIGVAPGAAHATKRWFPERFAEAADQLFAQISPSSAPSGHLPPRGEGNAKEFPSPLGRGQGEGKILIFGSTGDRAVCDAVASRLKTPSVNLAGKTSLPEMFSLLSRCRLVLTNDSGAMHAAAALGVPTVAVFGPTVESFGFFPTGPKAAVVQMDGLECRPCHLHGAEACPLGHFRCMADLSTERVVRAARGLL